MPVTLEQLSHEKLAELSCYVQAEAVAEARAFNPPRPPYSYPYQSGPGQGQLSSPASASASASSSAPHVFSRLPSCSSTPPMASTPSSMAAIGMGIPPSQLSLSLSLPGILSQSGHPSGSCSGLSSGPGLGPSPTGLPPLVHPHAVYSSTAVPAPGPTFTRLHRHFSHSSSQSSSPPGSHIELTGSCPGQTWTYPNTPVLLNPSSQNASNTGQEFQFAPMPMCMSMPAQPQTPGIGQGQGFISFQGRSLSLTGTGTGSVSSFGWMDADNTGTSMGMALNPQLDSATASLYGTTSIAPVMPAPVHHHSRPSASSASASAEGSTGLGPSAPAHGASGPALARFRSASEERRARNNEASKRSRRNQKVKQEQLMRTLQQLETSNAFLRTRIQQAETLNQTMKEQVARYMYNQP